MNDWWLILFPNNFYGLFIPVTGKPKSDFLPLLINYSDNVTLKELTNHIDNTNRQ